MAKRTSNKSKASSKTRGRSKTAKAGNNKKSHLRLVAQHLDKDTMISQADAPNRPQNFPELVSWPGMAVVCWIFSVLVGTIGLSGWLLGPKTFSSLGPNQSPIAHSEATIFILVGLSLAFYVYGVTRKFTKPIVTAVTVTTAVFSILKLAEYTGNTWFGIENIFNMNLSYFRRFIVGTMSPLSAVLFIAISVSIFLMVLVEDQRKRAIQWALGITTLSTLGTVVIVLSYCFGNPLMYSGSTTPVSLTAAVAFLFLEAGILIAIGPRHYPIQLRFNSKA